MRQGVFLALLLGAAVVFAALLGEGPPWPF